MAPAATAERPNTDGHVVESVKFYHPAVHGRKNLRARHLKRVSKLTTAQPQDEKLIDRFFGRLFNPRRAEKRIGPYLGRFTDEETGVYWDLRPDDAEPRGILILGPPGSGKSACNFIPTLLTFPESAFVYDPKFELFYLTSGYRMRALRNKILLFAPTRPDISCHINILDSIKWGTKFEIADLQNVVKLILDPADKAAEGAEAHWIATGSVLLECVILWLHYNDPKNCTLRGCYDFLSDPRWADLEQNPDNKTTAVDEALKYMLIKPHHPSGSMEEALKNGWVDAHKKPSPYHQYITHAATDIRGRAPNEKSGIASTTTRFLKPFQDDVLAELTSYSDFSFDDLMNYETPVTLYFCIPPSDVARLRVIVRLYLNLLVRAHTGDNALEYVDGTPVYRYRWRCLLAVDEFAQLGKQEQFMLALSVMRSYGLWPMLGVQIPNQIFEAFGRYQAVTGMLYYKVCYAPNDIDAAEWISKQLGNTTVVNETLTRSGSRFGPKLQASVSEQLGKEPLMEPAALTELLPNEVLVLATSQPPIRGTSIYWKANKEFRRRSGDKKAGGKYPAPNRSDVIPEHSTKSVLSVRAVTSFSDKATVEPVSPARTNGSPAQAESTPGPVAAVAAVATPAAQQTIGAGGTDDFEDDTSPVAVDPSLDPVAAATALLYGDLPPVSNVAAGDESGEYEAAIAEPTLNEQQAVERAAVPPPPVAPLSAEMQDYLSLADGGLEERNVADFYADEPEDDED